jgi:guanylate kinase
MAKGPLVILSGPSGSGKSTLTALLIERSERPLRLSVSATTRPARPGERDGVHYHFWAPDAFEAAVKDGAFLEWAEVHGHRYGTLRSEVEAYRDQGVGVLLDIDVQGARQVRQKCPDAASVFVKASSWEAYEQRLRKRRTEDEPAIQRRLEAARRELACVGEYAHVVINDDLESALEQLRTIVRSVW